MVLPITVGHHSASQNQFDVSMAYILSKFARISAAGSTGVYTRSRAMPQPIGSSVPRSTRRTHEPSGSHRSSMDYRAILRMGYSRLGGLPRTRRSQRAPYLGHVHVRLVGEWYWK